MGVQEAVIYIFAIIGMYGVIGLIWYKTSDFRYNFKLKYILKPKFKKGDCVLAPNRHNDPVLAIIESVSSDWKERKVEYTVYPMRYPDKYVDYDYFDRLVFAESCLMAIKMYDDYTWKKTFADEAEKLQN